jgi:putative ATP-binding cassette transporter
MRLLTFLLRYAPARVALAIGAGIISGGSSTGLLAVFNGALVGGSRSSLVWSFVGLCVLLPISRYISEILLSNLSQGALFDLRVRLSGQILAAPLRRLEELGAHRLMSALADDVPVITGTLVVFPLLCINTAVVIGGLIYLGLLSFKVLAMTLLFMAVGIATYQLPIIKAVRAFRRAREVGDRLFSQFRDLTEGAKELKLHRKRREAFLTEVMRPTADEFRRHSIAATTIYAAATSWGQILVFIVVGLVIFALPSVSPVSQSALFGYTVTLLFLMNPLQLIMNTMPNLGRASVALRRLEELGIELSAKGTEGKTAPAGPPRDKWNRLELRGVTHAYFRENEPDNFVLGPIDLTISPGELVFIVGGNGSGKTTLAKLLVGLYSPESGEILLDGAPVTSETRESFRELFSMVFSDFHLFEVLLGLDSSDLNQRALEYLVALRLDNKVKVEDGRFSTTNLSQGQRKRLALLTAYLEARPIYVFDEWAADQDPLFKSVFYYKLLPELRSRGKTVLVITHDDHYYGVADRIIKLEYGKVEYDGPLSSLKLQLFGNTVASAASEHPRS